MFSLFRILPRKFSGCIQKGNQVVLQKLFSCHLSVDFHQVGLVELPENLLFFFIDEPGIALKNQESCSLIVEDQIM